MRQTVAQIDEALHREIVDKINAWFSGDDSPALKAYRIGETEIQYIDRADLIITKNNSIEALRQAEINRRLAAGLGNPRKIKTRFK